MYDDIKNHLNSLLPGSTTQQGATRRLALKVALGTGYAVAALPVVAQTAIKTSSDGLNVGQALFEVENYPIPLYYAAPAGKKNLPVVVVVQEIFGVHEYIADVCRRFAKLGYLAVAPELYVRQGDPKSYTDIGKLLAEVANKVPDAQVMADLDGAVQWAIANGGNANKIGVTGFCRGGRTVWLYAAHSKNVKAGVAWYGPLVGTPSVLTPTQPVDVAVALQAPVLGLYGGQDKGIPVTTVNQMKEALSAAAAKGNRAAKACEFVLYPEAGHAFHADYRPTYLKEAAEDGFKRALEWFKHKGVA